MFPWLLILQAGASDSSLADIRFDLRNVPTATASDGAIVVTARRRDDQDVVRAEQKLPEPMLPRAEFRLGASRVAVEAQQQALGGGVVSNRAMVTLKIPF